jgi:hypothetical protein
MDGSSSVLNLCDTVYSYASLQMTVMSYNLLANIFAWGKVLRVPPFIGNLLRSLHAFATLGATLGVSIIAISSANDCCKYDELSLLAIGSS